MLALILLPVHKTKKKILIEKANNDKTLEINEILFENTNA